MDYKEITYEQAKHFYEVLHCPIYVGDMEKNPMAVSNVSIEISNKNLDKVIYNYKNYYQQDEIKFYLPNSWKKFAHY